MQNFNLLALGSPKLLGYNVCVFVCVSVDVCVRMHVCMCGGEGGEGEWEEILGFQKLVKCIQHQSRFCMYSRNQNNVSIM